MKTPGFGFERPNEGATNTWLTPPEIIRALGEFDLDPCAAENQPWPTAKAHYTEAEDGLIQPWFGRVWLNPPYGPHLVKWLSRMATHGHGTAFLFARTETAAFHDYVGPKATAFLFLRGRVFFHRPDGTPAGSPGAPSAPGSP